MPARKEVPTAVAADRGCPAICICLSFHSFFCCPPLPSSPLPPLSGCSPWQQAEKRLVFALWHTFSLLLLRIQPTIGVLLLLCVFCLVFFCLYVLAHAYAHVHAHAHAHALSFLLFFLFFISLSCASGRLGIKQNEPKNEKQKNETKNKNKNDDHDDENDKESLLFLFFGSSAFSSHSAPFCYFLCPHHDRASTLSFLRFPFLALVRHNDNDC